MKALYYVAPMGLLPISGRRSSVRTATFGTLNLQNEEQQGGRYHETLLGSANLVWHIAQRLSVGLECSTATKNEASGAHGDVWRTQLGMV